jgi:hypothetical protein
MTDRKPTSLERATVGELLTLLLWIESLPDDEIELDTAVKIEEDIAAVVNGLDDTDRLTFVQIARSLADDADCSGCGGGDDLRRALVDLGLVDEP